MKKRAASLRRGFLVRFVILAVVPLATVAMFFQNYLARALSESVTTNNQVLAAELARDTHDELHTALAILSQVHGVLQLHETQPQLFDELLDIAVSQSNFFESLYLIDAQGRIMAVGLQAQQRPLRRQFKWLDLSERPFVRKAIASADPVWSNAFHSIVTDKLSLTVSYPVGMQRWLLGSFNLERLTEVMHHLSVAKGMDAMVFDNQGVLLMHPNAALARQKPSWRNVYPVAQGLQGKFGTYRYHRHGNYYQGSIVSIPALGWLSMVAQLEDDAFQPVFMMRMYFFIGSLLAMVVGLLVAFRFAGQLARPMIGLAHNARQVAEGEYHIVPRPQHFHELQVLADSLRSMATDIEQRETQLHLAQQQLRHSQKMEAVGQLAGGIAHDFNNVLSGVLGNVSLAMMEVDTHSEVYALLQDIEYAGKRATELVRQLMAFSRKQVLDTRTLNMVQTLQETQALLSRLLGEDVQLQLQCEAAHPHILGDPSQLEQIIINLAVNARDAMPDGGRLTMSCENVAAAQLKHLTQFTLTADEYICLRVCDSGMGMEPDTSEKIFEPFFTTKQMGRGTGLGLSIVYGIVKQHEGAIEVHSQIGLGTTFSLYFPVVAPPDDEQRPAVQGTLVKGHEKVLVVEDDRSILKLLRRILQQLGYEVYTTHDPNQALGLAEKHGPMDVLLTDVIMPESNGYQLSRQLRHRMPALKVIFMSGHTDDVLQRHDLQREGARFLAKPFSFEALAEVLRDVLSDETAGRGDDN